MGWEQLWGMISNLGNLSLFVIAAAALLYYFGKIIGDIKVEKYEKTDYYIQGLFFSIFLIALPFVLVLYLMRFLNIQIPPELSPFFQIIILYFLTVSAFANWQLKRYGALSKKITLKALEKVKTKYLWSRTIKNEAELAKLYLTAYHKLSKASRNYYVLFFLSFIVTWSYYPTTSFGVFLSPDSIFLSILAFLNYSVLAINYGYAQAQYPPAKITLENGNEITGKILKFGEFIHLLKENEEKQLLINRDKIAHIEESLYAENEGDETNQEG